VTTSTPSESPRWSLGRHLRLAAMLCLIGWSLVYRFSEQSSKLPEFVYVNF
jgi:hypothetical protein